MRTVKKAKRRTSNKDTGLSVANEKMRSVELSLITGIDSENVDCAEYLSPPTESLDELAVLISKLNIAPGGYKIDGTYNKTFKVPKIVSMTKNRGIAKDFDVITKGLKRTSLSDDDFEQVNSCDDDDLRQANKRQRRQC